MANEHHNYRSFIGTMFPDVTEYERDAEGSATLFGKLIEDTGARYYMFQGERCPETGKPHFQFFIYYTNQRSLRAVQRKLRGSHVEPAANVAASIRYCSKEDTRILGPFEFGTIPSQGRRDDIETAMQSVSDQATERQLYERHPNTMVRYGRGIIRFRQLILPVRDRKSYVIVRWGVSGAGKTYAAYNGYPIGSVFTLSRPPNHSSVAWFDGYDPMIHKTLLLDDFYGWIRFGDMLHYMDYLPITVQTKGGTVNFAFEFIEITSNVEWKQWYKWDDIYEGSDVPFRRRIDEIHHYGEMFGGNN